MLRHGGFEKIRRRRRGFGVRLDIFGANTCRGRRRLPRHLRQPQGPPGQHGPERHSNIEKWTPELYPAGPPPNGTGTLTFVSDSTDTGHIRVKWTSDEQLLPIVFKSDHQISVADVDEFGVWIFSLYFRAGKVIVTRQTTNPGPGAVGALLTADCEFVGK